MSPARIHHQVAIRRSIKGGIDYVRDARSGRFHDRGLAGRVRALSRSLREG